MALVVLEGDVSTYERDVTVCFWTSGWRDIELLAAEDPVGPERRLAQFWSRMGEER